MAVNEMIYREFEKVGRALYIAGLQNTHSGNMSMRIGNRMVITRRGSMLGFLEPEDLVETSIFEPDSMLSIASTESHVHAAIYRETEALAIVHAHLIHATALSMVYDEIIPVDVEGSYHVRRVPVVEFEFGSGSEEMAEVIPEYLKNYEVIMIRGHGAVAVGETLEEAAFYCSSLENSSKIILDLMIAGRNPMDMIPERFKKW